MSDPRSASWRIPADEKGTGHHTRFSNNPVTQLVITNVQSVWFLEPRVSLVENQETEIYSTMSSYHVNPLHTWLMSAPIHIQPLTNVWLKVGTSVFVSAVGFFLHSIFFSTLFTTTPVFWTCLCPLILLPLLYSLPICVCTFVSSCAHVHDRDVPADNDRGMGGNSEVSLWEWVNVLQLS